MVVVSQEGDLSLGDYCYYISDYVLHGIKMDPIIQGIVSSILFYIEESVPCVKISVFSKHKNELGSHYFVSDHQGRFPDLFLTYEEALEGYKLRCD